MDSIIASMERDRFSDENRPYFSLFQLQPRQMLKLQRTDFKRVISEINSLYTIDNFAEESLSWYDMWQEDSDHSVDLDVQLIDLINHCTFFPAVRQAILLALTLPATSCTVERSFSTMRRVKTWLRTTMTSDRLSSLCMLSVHRARIAARKSEFVDEVIDKFGRDARKLQFLFSR
jgi:hypothetical protein